MRGIAITAVVMLAGAAQAMVPVPECTASGAEAKAGVTDYSTAWHGGGFVLYQVWSDRARLYLDDCVNARRLVMTPPKSRDTARAIDNEQAVYLAVRSALDATEAYTMAQIGAVARKAGARTALAAARYESCACDLYGSQI